MKRTAEAWAELLETIGSPLIPDHMVQVFLSVEDARDLAELLRAMAAEREALGMIQHYPAITRTYADGVVPEFAPDAWALVNDQGFVSGCWRERSVAEHVRSKSTRPDLERVVGVFFTGPGDQ
jgi:hypothetical protein